MRSPPPGDPPPLRPPGVLSRAGRVLSAAPSLSGRPPPGGGPSPSELSPSGPLPSVPSPSGGGSPSDSVSLARCLPDTSRVVDFGLVSRRRARASLRLLRRAARRSSAGLTTPWSPPPFGSCSARNTREVSSWASSSRHCAAVIEYPSTSASTMPPSALPVSTTVPRDRVPASPPAAEPIPRPPLFPAPDMQPAPGRVRWMVTSPVTAGRVVSKGRRIRSDKTSVRICPTGRVSSSRC